MNGERPQHNPTARPAPPRPASNRPRRSRAGLVWLLLAVAALAWEVAGRQVGGNVVTPARFLGAAWSVASGKAVGPPPPTEGDLQKSPFRALPYVVYGLKTNHRWGETRGILKTTNAQGYRGPDETVLPKPAGRYRIVCMGGSTTFSDSVSDEDAYPYLLQRELRAARPELDLDVVNAGVPSYTSAESLAALIFRILELKPDALVLYEGINDCRPRFYSNFDNSYFHFRKPWNGSLDGWEWGEGEMAGGINPFIQFNPPKPRGSKAQNVTASGTWAFRRNLEAICAVAAGAGVRVVLVTNAVHESNEPEMIQCIAEHNLIVRAVAHSKGALLVDLEPEFPKTGKLGKDSMFQDPVHLTAEGSRLKAKILARELVRGLLP